MKQSKLKSTFQYYMYMQIVSNCLKFKQSIFRQIRPGLIPSNQVSHIKNALSEVQGP